MGISESLSFLKLEKEVRWMGTRSLLILLLSLQSLEARLLSKGKELNLEREEGRKKGRPTGRGVDRGRSARGTER